MKTLYFIVAATILVEIASSTNTTGDTSNEYNCCAGIDVDDSSQVCNATQPCGIDNNQCSKVSLQFDDQEVVFRECVRSEDCSNATESYERLVSLLPFVQNISLSNSSQINYLEIKCCNAEKCNGVTFVNETASSVYNATINLTNNTSINAINNTTNNETNNATNNAINNATNNETNNATNNETVTNESSAELSCCSGTVVGDSTTPSSCDATALCSRNDDKCGTVQVQFGDQTAVFRGCLPSESCRNATEAYESAEEYFLTGGLNASQARPEDVVCCDTANCNGAGITKGKSFNVCFVVFMVLSYFLF